MAEYIDRKKAIKAIESMPNCYNGFSDTYDKACIIGVLEELPAVVERKHGKWIWKLADNGWADNICSVCGYTINDDAHVHVDYNFCPNCGADMRERDEKEM